MKRLLPAVVTAALLALVLRWPVTPRWPAAAEPPQAAAKRAERELSIGVPWGKVRGWERVLDGWSVTWQPAHGMWLVRAWVPDGPGDVLWRLDAASWLPGVRLSQRAAREVSGSLGGLGQAWERLGRRDWTLGGERLIGALPAGSSLPAQSSPSRVGVEAVLAGLLLAGAAARHLVPGVAGRGWRHAVSWAALTLLALLPQLSALAPAFRVGVRPWVGELAFGASAALVLGAVVFAAHRYPAAAGSPPGEWLAVALAAGVLAGRLRPAVWWLNVAALPLRLLAVVALTLLAGWLLGLAGDGLRELVRPAGRVRTVVLLGLAVAAAIDGGVWLAVALAVVAAAAVDRGAGTWMATAWVWGWACGSILALAQWEAALRDDLIVLLIGVGAVTVAGVARLHPLAMPRPREHDG